MRKLVKNQISVVVIAHNEERIIARCINSILESSYKKYEIIVVNDCSTDRTREITEKFIEKHPKKIRILNYEGDQGHGCGFPRNRGAEVAKGEIIFFFDADDYMLKDTLENIIKSFEKYKGINFIVGDRRNFVPDNWRRIFVYYGMRGKRRLNFLSSKKFVMPESESVSIEGHYPYIMKTKEFLKMGKHDENLYYNEDIEFNLRLQKKKIPKLISKKIIYYNDLGDKSRDFKRRCAVTAKSNMQHPSKMVGILIQFLMFYLAFPVFYPMISFIFLLRTEDILVSIFSPFIWSARRLFGVSHFLRFKILGD